jgi:hypothetical protein
MAKKLKTEEGQKLAFPAEPKCECCAMAGCPCCQPKIKSGATELKHVPKQQVWSHEKHPYFHNKAAMLKKTLAEKKKGMLAKHKGLTFAKKAAMAYTPPHLTRKLGFDF